MHFDGLFIYNSVTLEFNFNNNSWIISLAANGKSSKGCKRFHINFPISAWKWCHGCHRLLLSVSHIGFWYNGLLGSKSPRWRQLVCLCVWCYMAGYQLHSKQHNSSVKDEWRQIRPVRLCGVFPRSVTVECVCVCVCVCLPVCVSACLRVCVCVCVCVSAFGQVRGH